MKKINIFTKIGLGLYGIMTILDRFVVSIPNAVYIPLLLVGIGLILIGFFKAKNEL